MAEGAKEKTGKWDTSGDWEIRKKTSFGANENHEEKKRNKKVGKQEKQNRTKLYKKEDEQ